MTKRRGLREASAVSKVDDQGLDSRGLGFKVQGVGFRV